MKNTLTENQKCSLAMAYEAMQNITEAAREAHIDYTAIIDSHNQLYIGFDNGYFKFLRHVTDCTPEEIEIYEAEMMVQITGAKAAAIAKLREKLRALEG